MIQLQVLKEDTKEFMNKFLIENTFDNFEVRKIEVLTFTKFEISCEKNKDFYESDNNRIDFLLWKDIKNYVVNIIKGNKTPTYIRVVFSIPDLYLEKIHPNAKSLFLNMNYEDTVIFTTGSSQKEFAMNKDLDVAWDEYVVNYMKKHGVTTVQYEGE